MSENKFIQQIKDFINQRRTLSILIGTLIILIGGFLLLGDVIQTWNSIFKTSEKTEEEITVEWLNEHFVDTTYNVLILPFNDYQEDLTKRTKIERVIQGRLEDLKSQTILDSSIRSRINIKCFLEIPEFLSIDSINAIGLEYNADLIIFGDVYDWYDKPTKQANVKYSILSQSRRGFPFQQQGESGLFEFSSLAEIKEGTIIKDLDYLTIWIFCNEQLYYKRIKDAINISSSIDNNFRETIFRNSNAYLFYIIGNECYWDKDFNNAKIFFKKAITNNNKFAEAYIGLSLTYNRFSLHDSAKVLLDKALEIKPYSYSAHNNIATLYMQHYKNFNKARFHFKKAIELNKKYGSPYFNLGLLYGKYLSIPDSAVNYFLTALKFFPDSSDKIYNQIGNSFSDINDDSANFYYRKALTTNPRNATSYYELGRLYNSNEKYDSAKYNYLTALSLNPNYADAHNNLGLLFKNVFENRDSAYYHLNKALELDSTDSKYYYNLGLLYEFNFQKFDSALIFYRKAIELNPNYVSGYLTIGDFYRKRIHNIDSAKTYYEKTIFLDTLNVTAYNNLATYLHHNFNDYELAEKYYLKTISIDPSLGEAHRNYSDLLLYRLNNPQKAKGHYFKAVTINEKFRNVQLDEYFDKIK